MHALLERAIAAEPSTLLRDGDVIAAGYDAELDELRRIATHTDEFLLELERRERERTGLPSLKLGYNRVQGFYIEIPRAQAERVPTDYLRRQTVKSAERFITPELKGFEDKVLGARERALAREKELYDELLTQLIESLGAAAGHRHGAGRARCAGGLAERAAALDWSEPGARRRAAACRSTAARHPVVEHFSSAPFVPNDLDLDARRRMLVITGPNMGGKSTYMRQAALIALLAHIGSFVPADARAHRPARPHLHAHRRRRRSGRRALDLHGRDDRDRQHPAQRHRAQPGADGRDRPRHQHLRRPVAGLGGGARTWPPRCAPSRCSPRTTSS